MLEYTQCEVRELRWGQARGRVSGTDQWNARRGMGVLLGLGYGQPCVKLKVYSSERFKKNLETGEEPLTSLVMFQSA